MELLEDEMESEKILWIKKSVVKLEFCHPDHAQEQIQELKITHFPEFGRSGLFIKQSCTPRSEEDEIESDQVYIREDSISDLIVALQKYLDLDTRKET